MTRTTFTVGAIGDSITTAFNADAAQDNPLLSFATGEAPCGRVRSHLVRLRAALPTLDLVARNVAVSGARAAALPGQAQDLAASKPDYVTALIGANDVPHWLMSGAYDMMLATFAGQVRAAVRTLVAANPRVMILLLAIPDQSRVLTLALANGSPELAGLAARLPPTMIAGFQRAYVERHERANRALAEIAAEFPGQIRFADTVARIRFGPTHLSRHDFYHPSIEGQALLAETSWQHGFFP